MTAKLSMDDLLTCPTGRHLSRWAHLSKRERVFACYLALRRGWDLDTDRVRYDTDKDLLVIERPGSDRVRADASWRVVGREAADTLALIEDEFGPEARARAEAIIDAPERREDDRG